MFSPILFFFMTKYVHLSFRDLVYIAMGRAHHCFCVGYDEMLVIAVLDGLAFYVDESIYGPQSDVGQSFLKTQHEPIGLVSMDLKVYDQLLDFLTTCVEQWQRGDPYDLFLYDKYYIIDDDFRTFVSPYKNNDVSPNLPNPPNSSDPPNPPNPPNPSDPPNSPNPPNPPNPSDPPNPPNPPNPSDPLTPLNPFDPPYFT